MARFTTPGVKGDSGQSFTLLGNYPNLAAFEAGAGSSPGNPGDCYLLESDGSLMVYSVEDGWFDAGDIIGQYGRRVFWRRLGMTLKLRDRVYEVSGTDPVKVVIIGAELLLSPTNA